MNNLLYNSYINFISLPKSAPIDDNYHIIGIYDKKNKIWYNAWGLYTEYKNQIEYNKYKKSKDLLIYALKLEKDNNSITDTEKMLLRYILVNAKIYITEKRTQLDIIISTIAYLIKAKKYDYISNNNLIFVTMQTNF